MSCMAFFALFKFTEIKQEQKRTLKYTFSILDLIAYNITFSYKTMALCDKHNSFFSCTMLSKKEVQICTHMKILKCR